MSQTPIVLLSGRDLQRLLRPEAAIEALRETYAALADHRGDQGRSVDFVVEGGSIHVKSGLLPGSHLAFASKSMSICRTTRSFEGFQRSRASLWCPTRKAAGRWQSWSRLR